MIFTIAEESRKPRAVTRKHRRDASRMDLTMVLVWYKLDSTSRRPLSQTTARVHAAEHAALSGTWCLGALVDLSRINAQASDAADNAPNESPDTVQDAAQRELGGCVRAASESERRSSSPRRVGRANRGWTSGR